jgi:hypothetical protein
MISDLQVFATDGFGVVKSILCSESVRDCLFVAVMPVSLRRLRRTLDEVLTACVCHQLDALEIQNVRVGCDDRLFQHTKAKVFLAGQEALNGGQVGEVNVVPKLGTVAMGPLHDA